MIEYRAAAATDVGRVRSGNEDSFHRGDAVFAVADGMGGHVAGEVASRTALGPLAELDGKVFPDGPAAVRALRDAVVHANVTVAEKARFEPDYRGMGTTLTAVMIEGRRVHLAHVGDSRAYLRRNGVFQQVTTDHTLVQHLIDEGQITAEEAATHPQRSIITRAIGVGLEVDVDTMTLDVEPGDELLLCSDGLTGAVPDGDIARTLEEEPDPQRVVDQLVAAANANGGHDNITIVLLRFAPEGGFPPLDRSDEDADGAADVATAGAVAINGSRPTSGRTVIRSGGDTAPDGWAEKLGRLGAGRVGDEGDSVRSRPTLGGRALAVLLVLAVLLALAAGGGRWLLGRSYFVGASDGHVAIYQGVPTSLGPLPLSWIEEVTDLRLDRLPRFMADDVRAGRAAASLADARNIVRNLRQMTEDEPGDSPSPSPDSTSPSSPEPSPSASPTP